MRGSIYALPEMARVRGIFSIHAHEHGTRHKVSYLIHYDTFL